MASLRPGGGPLVRSLFMPNETLLARLRGTETLYGGWTVIADVIAAGAMAAAGLDYVVIDLQHGGATEHDLPALTAAIARAGATPVARVRYAHPADIGRALDLGCAGVIVPNVDSAGQASAAVGACHYPPAGYRSAGGALASTDEPFCVIMVESAAALADLDATLAVPGVDGIYVGPRDLSWVHSTDGATARMYRGNGCRLVNVAFDVQAIARAARAELAVARRLTGNSVRPSP